MTGPLQSVSVPQMPIGGYPTFPRFSLAAKEPPFGGQSVCP
jgi:hypothetical protein